MAVPGFPAACGEALSFGVGLTQAIVHIWPVLEQPHLSLAIPSKMTQRAWATWKLHLPLALQSQGGGGGAEYKNLLATRKTHEKNTLSTHTPLTKGVEFHHLN